MGKRRKKYNPMAEVMKMSAGTSASVIGVAVPHMIMGGMPAGTIPASVSNNISTATNMMGMPSMVGAAGSVLGSLSLLEGSSGSRRKKKRR